MVRKSHGFSRRLLALFSVLALVLALTACAKPAGEAERPADVQKQVDERTKEAAQASAATPAAPKPVAKVKIAQGAHAISFLPIYVARYLDYFSDEGVSAEVIMVNGGSIAMTAVLSGDVAFGAIATPTVINAAEKGQPVLSIANLINQMTLQGAIRPQILKDAKIEPDAFAKLPWVERVKLLKGKKMGITSAGSVTDQFTRAIVSAAGMNPDKDVLIQPLGTSSAMLAALKAGTLDSFVISPPVSVQPVVDGTGLTYIKAGELPGMDDFVYEVIYTQKDYAAKNPEVVAAVARAMARTNNYILDTWKNKPDELVKIVKWYFADLNEKTLRESIAAVVPPIPKDALQTEKGWKSSVDFLVKYAKTDASKVKTAEGGYWTNQYVNTKK